MYYIVKLCQHMLRYANYHSLNVVWALVEAFLAYMQAVVPEVLRELRLWGSGPSTCLVWPWITLALVSWGFGLLTGLVLACLFLSPGCRQALVRLLNLAIVVLGGAIPVGTPSTRASRLLECRRD